MGATAALSMTAVSSVGNAYANSQARKAQALYQQGIYNVNSQFAEFQAKDSIERGEFQASEIERQSKRDLSFVKKKAAQVKGRQRVSLAAQGIEITSGSAAEILAETDYMRELDEIDIRRAGQMNILTIKNNAWREAWGFKAQSMGYQFKGRISRLAGDNEARNTLITGGLQGMAYLMKAGAKYRSLNPGGGGSGGDEDSGGDGFYMPGGS